jgi:hypothetical protein
MLNVVSLVTRRRFGPIIAGACLAVLAGAHNAGAAALHGIVNDAATSRAIAGARVNAASASVTTGDSGGFVLDLDAGRHQIEVTAQGYDPARVTVTIGDAERAETTIVLFPRGYFKDSVDVIAPREAIAQPPSVTPIKPMDVVNVAGGSENVFRVLTTLPGVSGTDEFSSRLSVRGGGPDQNLTVMDGIEIHNPYRLYGLVSAFNPETVERFELTAGAFSAKHGDRLSSLLVVENREGAADRSLAASAALSMTDANVIVEGGLPRRRGSWLVTARRTYYDLIVERFIDYDLPSFNDVQGKLVWDLGHGSRLSLFGLTSREGTDMSFTEEEQNGAVFTRTRNDLVSSTLFVPFGRRGSSRTIAAFYRNTDEMDFGGLFKDEARRSNAPGDAGFGMANMAITYSYVVRDASLRQEIVMLPSKRHVIETGFEAHRLRNVFDMRIAGELNPAEANGSSLGGGAGLPDTLLADRPPAPVERVRRRGRSARGPLDDQRAHGGLAASLRHLDRHADDAAARGIRPVQAEPRIREAHAVGLPHGVQRRGHASARERALAACALQRRA